MPRSQQARFSFDAGVLTPRMTLRADTERHQTACQVMQNFIVTPQGGAVFRHGMKDIGQPFDPDNPFRVFTFKDGGDRSDTIFEVGPGTTRFWRDDELLDNPTPLDLSISNPYDVADLNDLLFANHESLSVITSEDHPPQFMLLTAIKTITDVPFPFNLVPEMTFFDYKSPRLSNTEVEYSIVFNSAWNEGDRFSFSYGGIPNFDRSNPYEPIDLTYPFRDNDNEMADILELAFRDVIVLKNATITVTNTPGESWEATVTSPAAGRSVGIFSFSGADKSASATIITGNDNSGAEPAWSYPYVVEHNGTFYQCILPHTSIADNEPGVGAAWESYWVALPGEPDWWDYQHDSNNPWVLGSIYSPWDRGWPRVVEFHQQRLILGGSRDAPTAIWGSRIGTYTDFSTGPNDTDPVQFSIETSDTPKIKWMSSTSQGLLIGTSAGEFIISAQISLSPSDIQSQRQNYSRAAAIDMVKVNNIAFYVEQGNTKLRASQYSRQLQGYDSIDASLMAEHLIRQPGLRRLTMMRTPESVLFMLRNDGTMAFMTYDNAQGIGAWAESTSEDPIFDMGSVYSFIDKEDEIYVCVERRDGFHLEKMVYPSRSFGENLAGAVHLDSYEEGVLVAAQAELTGLERFADTTVFLTVNDAIVGSRDVDALGVMQLNYPSEDNDRYAVGYQYDGHIITFENSTGNPRGVGFGTARNWNKLWVRILDSGLPKINGILPPDRTPASLMNLPEPLRSEDARVANIGYGDGSIDLLQDLPYPTYIIGVYGEFVTHNV